MRSYQRRCGLRGLIGGTIALLAAGRSMAQNNVTFLPGGGEIDVSGATLFADFFESPAGTNDYINVNGNWVDCNTNGVFDNGEIARAGFYDSSCPPSGSPSAVDQLAQNFTCPNWTGYWLLNFRGVGSGNGLREFVDFHLLGTIPYSVPTERGNTNRRRWALNGVKQNIGCGEADCNTNGPDSGAPVCPMSIDLAVMDVPTKWFVVSGAAANRRWNRKPTQNGYGLNTRLSTTGDVAVMQSLSRVDGNNTPLSLNTNTASPNASTMYDTPIAFVPIAFIANRGTGVENIDGTELQHLYVTGRLPNGENLVAATRDRGSGTRNGMMNSLGVDPSYGVGENLGNELADGNLARLGAGNQASNLGGSGIMEDVVQNRRLAIGYTGLAGSSRAAGDALAGRYEIINVMKDFGLPPGSQNVRPSINSVLDNADADTGWQFGGPETFASRGDPEAGFNGNTNPAMTNSHARDYLRNVTQSILGFIGNPPGDQNFNMPGEFLATTFFLTASVDAAQDPVDPVHFIDQTSTPNFNETLQTFVRATNGLGIGGDTPAYGSRNISGKVPNRTTLSGGQTYSDGRTGSYVDAFGNTVNAGINLSQRNQIAGDFNADHVRDINDIPGLMAAVAAPRLFEANMNWGGDTGQMATDSIIPEVIGDFDGDGNFNRRDVRYFADGLAIIPLSGRLDRKAGFIAVDNAWGATPGHIGDTNYFDTVLAGPKAYAPGDSRADFAGNLVSRGAQPTGADGRVDAKDIDYVLRNFGTWSNIDQAVNIDLSADINGDLVINQADADELVHSILCTEYGDANLDGRVNSADATIVQNSITTPPANPGWANGDLNGDGVVNAADMTIVSSHLGFRSACLPCSADIDGSGSKTAADVTAFVNALLGTNTDPQQVMRSDQNGDGAADGADIQPFVGCFFQP